MAMIQSVPTGNCRVYRKRIYVTLKYGAGDAQIGKIVKGDAKDGKRLKREFLKKTPAIALLKKARDNPIGAAPHKRRRLRCCLN